MATTTPTTSFWTRLTGSFRRQARHNGDRPRSPVMVNPLPPAAPAAEPVVEPAEATADAPERGSGPLARWTRRDQAIVQLQEGYEKVTRVIEEIQKHLVQQGERSERLCGALDRIAQSLAEGPKVARQQAETLERIVGQMESSNARAHQLAEIVAEIPKSARNQTETLVGISRQLEVSNEQRVVSSQTMDRLGSSLQSLGQTSQTQSEILKQMNVTTAEQNRQLAQLITEHNKRFQWLFGLTIAVSFAAIAAAALGLYLRP